MLSSKRRHMTNDHLSDGKNRHHIYTACLKLQRTKFNNIYEKKRRKRHTLPELIAAGTMLDAFCDLLWFIMVHNVADSTNTYITTMKRFWNCPSPNDVVVFFFTFSFSEWSILFITSVIALLWCIDAGG